MAKHIQKQYVKKNWHITEWKCVGGEMFWQEVHGNLSNIHYISKKNESCYLESLTSSQVLKFSHAFNWETAHWKWRRESGPLISSLISVTSTKQKNCGNKYYHSISVLRYYFETLQKYFSVYLRLFSVIQSIITISKVSNRTHQRGFISSSSVTFRLKIFFC